MSNLTIALGRESMQRMGEMSKMTDELADRCRRVDELVREQQQRGVLDSLTVARELVRLVMRGGPRSAPIVTLNLRAEELDRQQLVAVGRELPGMTTWRECWQRFEAALALSVSDVMAGRECDLTGRLILWRPVVRSSS
jgi:hypothetical protein